MGGSLLDILMTASSTEKNHLFCCSLNTCVCKEKFGIPARFLQYLQSVFPVNTVTLRKTSLLDIRFSDRVIGLAFLAGN